MEKPEEKELVKELVVEINEKSANVENVAEELPYEKTRYKRDDTTLGYLTDPQEIEEYKRRQQIEVMTNHLLGDFDENGIYSVSDEVKNELIKCKKEIVEQYKTYVFVNSVYPIPNFGNVKFFVTVEKVDNSKLKAKLVLLEKVKKINGYIINTLDCALNEFEGDAAPKFYDDMKKAFNIINVDKKTRDDDLEEEFKHCSLRKLYEQELWNLSKKGIEKLEKNIYEKRINTLTELSATNPFAKKVLQEQEQKKAQLSGFFLNGTQDKYSALNSLLENIIAGLGVGVDQVFVNSVNEVVANSGVRAKKEQAEIIAKHQVDAITKSEIANNNYYVGLAQSKEPIVRSENNKTVSHVIGNFAPITGFRDNTKGNPVGVDIKDKGGVLDNKARTNENSNSSNIGTPSLRFGENLFTSAQEKVSVGERLPGQENVDKTKIVGNDLHKKDECELGMER